MYNFAYYADVVGISGVTLTLVAYYLLNTDRIPPNSMAYLLLNLIGAFLLLFSLLFHWNLSSVVIEISWISISLLGLYRFLKNRKAAELKNANNVYLLKGVKKGKV